MRTHKYKYWYSGKMIEVGSIQFMENGTYIVNDELVGGVLLENTNLLDKNGKEIYEGDVCKGLEKEQNKGLGFEIKQRVDTRYGGFMLFGHPMQDFTVNDKYEIKHLMWKSDGHLNITDTYWEILDIEIIGNIYENPDLLTPTIKK